MKNIHNPNLVGISLWGPQDGHINTSFLIALLLISPTEISVNWPGSKQLRIGPIYTH